MAKKMMSSEMMCSSMDSCGPKCILSGIIAAVFGAGGLWAIVSGIMMQWNMAPLLNVLLWYAGGMLLLMVAKCIKMKACSMCRGM